MAAYMQRMASLDPEGRARVHTDTNDVAGQMMENSFLYRAFSQPLGLFVLWCSVALVVWYLSYMSWVKSKRRGPYAWPFAGSTLEVFLNRHRPLEWHFDQSRRHKSYGVTAYGNTTLFTASAKDAYYILKEKVTAFDKGEMTRKIYSPLLGSALLNLDGPKWWLQRQMVLKELLNIDFAHYVVDVAREEAVMLLAVLGVTSRSLSGLVDLQNLFERYTDEVAYRTAFGERLGTLDPGLPPCIPAGSLRRGGVVAHEHVTGSMLVRLFGKGPRHIAAPARLYAKIVVSRRRLEMQRVLRKAFNEDEGANGGNGAAAGALTDGANGARRRSTSEIEEEEAAPASPDVGGEDTPRDLLSRFLGYEDPNKEPLKDEEVTSLSLNCAYAATGPSAPTLAWVFAMLHLHPRVEAAVMEEIEGKFKEGPAKGKGKKGKAKEGSEPSPVIESLEDLDSDVASVVARAQAFAKLLTLESTSPDAMPYLHAVISETLRLYPQVPHIRRQSQREDTLPSGLQLFRESPVCIDAYSLGRDPDLWGPDAAEFRPERWLQDGQFVAVDAFKWPVFSAGPRACMGKDMAFVLLKLAIVMVMRFYYIKVVPGQTLTYAVEDFLRMADGLGATLEFR